MPSFLSRIRQSAVPRQIDRAVGTPLLRLLGAVRRRRPVPARIQRIGILAFETIGDTLLAATLIASFRKALPEAEIVVFASEGNAGVLPLIDGIARGVTLPLTRPLAALRALREVPLDVTVDIGQWPRWYALLAALSRSRFTVGFATPGQSRHDAFDVAVVHRSDVHELENFQRLLAPFPGVVTLPPGRALKPVGEPPATIAAQRPYVVVHPWASGFNFAAREWPIENWVALIRRVCVRGHTVLVSGSPGDRERAGELQARCAGLPVESLAGRWSLAELAAILRRAQAVVCVNTGIMHLAALLDVPLVALHGPTSRRRWGPVGSRSIALAPESAAPGEAEFLNLGFEYPPGPVDCMRAISVDEVDAALCKLLGAVPASP